MPEDRSVAIALEGVSKGFGKVAAVNDVSLSIGEGEFFSLLGPSGCGKTTSLRMIAGFEQPDAGRILLQGDDVTRVPPNRRPVNMVFQQYALFPHMSVYDNVAFGLKVKRVDRPREIYERPATAFVADFIGSLNAFDFRLDERIGDNGVMRVGEGERIVVPVEAGNRPGETLRAAVRPEHVRVELAGASELDGGSRLEGTVAEIVFLGMYTQFHVDTTAGRFVPHRVGDESLEPLEPGARGAPSWEPEPASLPTAQPAL